MAAKAVLIFTVQLLVCLPCLNAYPQFRARLPNVGLKSRVPAPFNQKITDIQMTNETTCASIGHVARCSGAPSGGGNPFGQAFYAQARASSTWTEAICNADSDRDGHSNGVELGDPNCTWTMGTAPERTTCLSHPGFACSTPTDPHCEGRTTAPQCATQMTTTSSAATMTTTGSAATMTTTGSAATMTTTGSAATMTMTGSATTMTTTGSAATMTTTGSAATMSTTQADAASPTPSGSSGVALRLKEHLVMLSLAIVTTLGLIF